MRTYNGSFIGQVISKNNLTFFVHLCILLPKIMKTQPKTYFVLFGVVSILFLLLYLMDTNETHHLAMFFANFTLAAYFFKKSKQKLN